MPLSKIVILSASAAALAAVVPLLATHAAAQRYFPGMASVPTSPSDNDQGPVTPVHAVFLRAGPSVAAPVIGTLQPGMPLQVLASANYGWRQVNSPAGTGWIYGSYLTQGISAP